MKAKQVLVLLVVLAALAGASFWVLRPKGQGPGGQHMMGRPLLGEVPWGEVSAISIRGAAGSVDLVQRDGRWMVKERFGYPADFGRIENLVRSLRECKVGRVFTADAEGLGRMALRDPGGARIEPSEAATVVELRDGQERVVVQVLVGKTPHADGGRPGQSGQYVRLGADPAVYLVDAPIAVDASPADWLNRALLRVIPTEVAAITCLSADGRTVIYALKRGQAGNDFTLTAPKKQSGALNAGAANRLGEALTSVQMLDLAGPYEGKGDGRGTDKEFPVRIEYRLSNGLVYRLYPGASCRGDAGCPLRIGVAYEKPEGEQAAAAGSGSKDTEAELSAKAETENRKLAPWVFLVPKWKYDGLAATLDQLLQKPAGTGAGASG